MGVQTPKIIKLNYLYQKVKLNIRIPLSPNIIIMSPHDVSKGLNLKGLSLFCCRNY